MTSCTICSRPLTSPEAAEGRYACRPCTDRTAALLRELPLQERLLAACLEPDGAPRAGRLGGTGRAHSPMPVREDVLALIGPGHYTDDGHVTIAAALAGWARYIAQHAGWHRWHHPDDGHEITEQWADPWPRQGPTVTGWCAWLTAYLPVVATRPYIRDLDTELTGLAHRARAITQVRPWRRKLDAPCPACHFQALTERWAEDLITCEVCEHQVSREQYAEHVTRLARTALLMVAARATATQQYAPGAA